MSPLFLHFHNNKPFVGSDATISLRLVGFAYRTHLKRVPGLVPCKDIKRALRDLFLFPPAFPSEEDPLEYRALQLNQSTARSGDIIVVGNGTTKFVIENGDLIELSPDDSRHSQIDAALPAIESHYGQNSENLSTIREVLLDLTWDDTHAPWSNLRRNASFGRDEFLEPTDSDGDVSPLRAYSQVLRLDAGREVVIEWDKRLANSDDEHWRGTGSVIRLDGCRMPLRWTKTVDERGSFGTLHLESTRIDFGVDAAGRIKTADNGPDLSSINDLAEAASADVGTAMLLALVALHDHDRLWTTF